MKHHQNSDTRTGNREPQQNYRLGMVSNELRRGGGGVNYFFGTGSSRVANNTAKHASNRAANQARSEAENVALQKKYPRFTDVYCLAKQT